MSLMAMPNMLKIETISDGRATTIRRMSELSSLPVKKSLDRYVKRG